MKREYIISTILMTAMLTVTACGGHNNDSRPKDMEDVVDVVYQPYDSEKAVTRGIPDSKYPSKIDGESFRSFKIQIDDVVYPTDASIGIRDALDLLESSAEDYKYEFDPDEVIYSGHDFDVLVKKNGSHYFTMTGMNLGDERKPASECSFTGFDLEMIMMPKTDPEALVNNIYFPGGYRPFDTKGMDTGGIKNLLPGLKDNPVGVIMGLADGHYIIGDNNVGYLSLISEKPVGDRRAVKELYIFSINPEDESVIYMSPTYSVEYEGSFDDVDWNTTRGNE